MSIFKRLCVITAVLGGSITANAEPLNLVTTEWETFTSDGPHSARLNDFVEQAFSRAGYEVNISIERPAFAGSGLNSGKYDGRIDFIDLTPPQTQFAYSKQYFPVRLHLIGKQPDVESVRTFSQIRNARVAVESRYAATPSLRLVSEVKWSRNPTTFESIANLAGERSNYLLSDSLMFSEFNRLLYAENEEILHKSEDPMFVTGLQVSLNSRIEGNTTILDAFNTEAEAMLLDGSVNHIFGIEWILADADGDGDADWITSTQVSHPSLAAKDYPNSVSSSAYQWDDSNISEGSTIIINGVVFTDWTTASEQLTSNVSEDLRTTRISFLDHDAYKDILRKW